MNWVERLDRYQRQHRILGFPLAVIYKYGDDQGPYLGAIITYYAFIAIFPSLLISSSVLGFVLQDNPDWRDSLLESALSQFPIIGDQLGRPEGVEGSRSAIVVGALVGFYGVLGLGQAVQNAADTVWSVPRNKRGNPFLARARSLALMTIAGSGLVLLAIVSALISNLEALVPALDAPVLIPIFGFLLSVFVFYLLFRLVSHRRSKWRSALPGAVVTACLWALLQIVGRWYVQTVINRASEMNGTFALVLGLLGFIYLAALMAVIGLEVNVVIARRLYPRALLTPFTDNVQLTRADRAAYTHYAVSQRHKGFQTVTVQFIEDDEPEGEPPASRDDGSAGR